LGRYDTPLINIGCGRDIAISELAEQVRETVGFDGRIVYDTDKPDGTPRKLLDVSRLEQLGWRYQIGLQQGVADTYQWCLQAGVF
ncbi:MAG: GDP-L-fucose synthase, partial [Thermodesulfobacteriota bacterium]